MSSCCFLWFNPLCAPWRTGVFLHEHVASLVDVRRKAVRKLKEQEADLNPTTVEDEPPPVLQDPGDVMLMAVRSS